jgi:RNA polymerase sigma-70 factor (ECF subfamily)
MGDWSPFRAMPRSRDSDLGDRLIRSPGHGPPVEGRSYSRQAMGADGRERAWVRGARAGRVEDFDALFRHHWPRAYRAAYLVVHDAAAAEDIAQEAFLAAIRSLDRFDRRRPFGPWLHRIVVNRAIDWARARTLRAESGGESLAREVAPDPGGGLPERLLSAIRDLPPDQRAVIVLRHVLEYTPGEIAELLDLPRGTVNSRLRRALDALAAELEDER